MTTEFTSTAVFSATRAIHFGACLVAFGVFIFDRLVARPAGRHAPHMIDACWRPIARALIGIALPAALLSGAAWFSLSAMDMSGSSLSQAFSRDMVGTVWTQTHFGNLWHLRCMILSATFAVCLLAVTLSPRSSIGVSAAWFALLATGALLGSLAWAGHGLCACCDRTPSSLRDWTHLTADGLHLMISGVWPVGLLPFALLLAKLRAEGASGKWHVIAALIRRFSMTSLVCVILLTATGIVNSLPLVDSWAGLFTTNYGRVLTVKVSLFLLMTAVGAVNLLYLKPRLARDFDAGTDSRNLSILRAAVWTELCIGVFVILCVGLLGILPPAVEMCCKMAQ